MPTAPLKEGRWATNHDVDSTDHSTVCFIDSNGGIDSPEAIVSHIMAVKGISMPGLNFCQRAIEAMTPTLESGFSLGNFLYEIREISSLIKWWRRGRSLFKNLSDATLNYNFGVRPFLMDVRNSVRGLLSLQDRLAELKAGAGKLQVRHYSEEDNGLDFEESWDFNTNNEGRATYRVPQAKYCASMTYTYQYPDLDRAHEELYALLDTFGLQLNPQIIWDAIPYSFVVDWFFDVGDYLSQLRKKWIDVQITIKDFGVSCKFEFSGSTTMRGYGAIPSPWVPRTDFSGKFYHRKPLKVEDRMFTISQQGSLTLRKFVLGALLVKQRI
jgi:hypothetical protein